MGDNVVVWPRSKRQTKEPNLSHTEGGGGYAWIPPRVLESNVSPLAKVCFAWMTSYPREREDLRAIDLIAANPNEDPDEVWLALIDLVSIGAIRACDQTDPDNPGYEVIW